MAKKQSGRKWPVKEVDPQVQERLREVAGDLRQMMYGEKGCPEWGTLFREIEADGMSVGLELARLLMEQATSEQAEAAGRWLWSAVARHRFGLVR